MSIPFPSDNRFPHLGSLLNEEAMLGVIKNATSLELLGCKPKYVRYKPHTNCVLQYDLKMHDDIHGEIFRSAHIKVYADGLAKRKATGRRARRILDRCADLAPDTRRITYLHELQGVFQLYPADLDLRHLVRAANKKEAAQVLGSVLGTPDTPRLQRDPEPVRHKPGRKALLRYQLTDRSIGTLYGKVFKDADVSRLQKHTDALIAGGFRTARVAGIAQDHNFIVHQNVKGVTLADLRNELICAEWMEPLANSLWDLQRIELPGLRVHRLADEMAALLQVTNQLGYLVPHLASRLDRLLGILGQCLADFNDELVTSHGDFYDDQALVSEDGVTIIDLDELRCSHPFLDVGNMLAHLSAGQSQGDETEVTRGIFLEEALRHFGTDERSMALFESIGLLKLAPGPFRRLEQNWPEGIERHLELAEERLFDVSRMVNSTSDRMVNASVTDPKLPQLLHLLDRNAMTKALTEDVGAFCSSVQRIELVRHKPGRRAILRFESAEGEVLFGKTYASNRGPKVYEVARTIASADAFGPDVILPEPVAWVPDSKLLLMQEVQGIAVEKNLIQGDTELAIRIAFALYHLHSSEIDLGRSHDLDAELSPLASRCDDIARLAPHLASAAYGVLENIRAFDTSDLPWRSQPVHRDMYHDQVLIDHDHLVILDLDDAATSDPTIDVANFVAHLMLLGMQRQGSTNALRTVIDAFITQYRLLDDDLHDDLLSFLIATTLLRLAGIHVDRQNGVAIARALIDASTSFLACDHKVERR